MKSYFVTEGYMGLVNGEAITAFLESERFEDAIRNAVSLSGDTDTLAAITGIIAEAFYGISAIMRAECRDRVEEDMLNILELFDEIIGRKDIDENEYIAENKISEEVEYLNVEDYLKNLI